MPLIKRSEMLPTLFVLPLSMDFRSATAGGSAWQFSLVGITALAWVLLMVRPTVPRAQGALWKFSQNALLLCAIGAVISFVVNDAPLDRFIRVFGPVALFIMAFYVGQSQVRAGAGDSLLRLVMIGSTFSVAFTFVAGFAITGASLAEIRYQIISPVLLTLQALLLYQLVVENVRLRRRWLILAALVVCVAIQILSTTRSALLAALLLILAASWIRSPSHLAFTRRTIFQTFLVALVGGVAILITTLAAEDLAERWIGRLLVSSQYGFDPTTLTRVAEIKDQMDIWGESLTTMFVGKGYGAEYGWSTEYFRDLMSTGAFTTELLDLQFFDFGHNFWVSSLFSAGLLFGTALPAVLIIATLCGLKASRVALRRGADPKMTKLIGIGTMILASLLVTTIGGNPFGPRYMALIGGLGLGMLVIARREVLRARVGPAEKGISGRATVRGDLFSRRS